MVVTFGCSCPSATLQQYPKRPEERPEDGAIVYQSRPFLCFSALFKTSTLGISLEAS